MRVIHINVRLSEGGAAKLALDLHRRLLEKAVESKLFYGYGPRAKKSPWEEVAPHAYQVGSCGQVVGNYFIHKLIGIDILNPLGRRASSLRSALRDADIVHLHAIHSHFISYTWLFKLIGDLDKKIVWTFHDSWALTGRCAITGDCERWLYGCGSCPFMTNYPSAKIDLSGFESKRKRKEISSLRGNLVLVGCSQWITRRARIIFPDHEIRFVPNGLDQEMENHLKAKAIDGGEATDKPNLLVISADLSNSQKQDLSLIKQIIRSGECTLHTVGKHSPFRGANVVNHGSISERSRLAEIYRTSDATLFTSKVDNFSLVIVESLSAGTPVLALDSPGSREVLGLVGAKPVRDNGEMLSRVQRRSFFDLYRQRTRADLQNKALESFSGESMVKQYLNIYKDMLNDESV